MHEANTPLVEAKNLHEIVSGLKSWPRLRSVHGTEQQVWMYLAAQWDAGVGITHNNSPQQRELVLLHPTSL